VQIEPDAARLPFLVGIQHRIVRHVKVRPMPQLPVEPDPVPPPVSAAGFTPVTVSSEPADPCSVAVVVNPGVPNSCPYPAYAVHPNVSCVGPASRKPMQRGLGCD